MEEIGTILQALRSYGPKGAVLMGFTVLVGTIVRSKLEQSSAKRAANDSARAQLVSMLQDQTTQTLTILERELKVQQETNSKFFDLLDRNTRSVEKMVEKLDEMGTVQGAMDKTISKIEGAVSRPS